MKLPSLDLWQLNRRLLNQKGSLVALRPRLSTGLPLTKEAYRLFHDKRGITTRRKYKKMGKITEKELKNVYNFMTQGKFHGSRSQNSVRTHRLKRRVTKSIIRRSPQ
jgi:hypothetical protein